MCKPKRVSPQFDVLTSLPVRSTPLAHISLEASADQCRFPVHNEFLFVDLELGNSTTRKSLIDGVLQSHGHPRQYLLILISSSAELSLLTSTALAAEDSLCSILVSGLLAQWTRPQWWAPNIRWLDEVREKPPGFCTQSCTGSRNRAVHTLLVPVKLRRSRRA